MGNCRHLTNNVLTFAWLGSSSLGGAPSLRNAMVKVFLWNKINTQWPIMRMWPICTVVKHNRWHSNKYNGWVIPQKCNGWPNNATPVVGTRFVRMPFLPTMCAKYRPRRIQTFPPIVKHLQEEEIHYQVLSSSGPHRTTYTLGPVSYTHLTLPTNREV